MRSAKAVQVTQMPLDCHEWENTPDTPQPASPFSEDGGGSKQENATVTITGHSFFLSEDSTSGTEAGLLAQATGIVTRIFHSLLAMCNSTVIPWAVNSFFIMLGGIVIATSGIGWMIQQLLSQGTTILVPGALLLWRGSCAALATVFTNVAKNLTYYLGLLHQPRMVVEFPIQAPADPTFYDQATVIRMIMSIKYEDHNDVDDEDTIMYGYDDSGYSFRNRTVFMKNRIRNLCWKLISKHPVDYQ